MSFNAEFLWDGVAPEEEASTVTFPWKGDKTNAEAHMTKITCPIPVNVPKCSNGFFSTRSPAVSTLAC